MKTFEEWIKIANEIHENKYTYIKRYKKYNNYYLDIECRTHGIFSKKIQNHTYKKQGCPKCIVNNKKYTTKEFIEKANKIHNNEFDYSLVDYKKSGIKIKIICKKHGLFEQTPTNHLRGNKCPNCSKTKKITKDVFIQRCKKIHNEKYEYTKIIFNKMSDIIEILCKKHGYYTQRARDHLNGNGCYKCIGKIRTTSDFIEKANIIHKKLYSYDETIYKSARSKIIITCKIHGNFIQSPNDHLNGNGCQKCSLGRHSKMCINWLNSIMDKNNIFIQHAGNIGEKKIKYGKKLYWCDGYCEENNTIYEFYGDFWHGNPKKYDKDDINPINKIKYGKLYEKTLEKEEILSKLGYNIISIWESEYN